MIEFTRPCRCGAVKSRNIYARSVGAEGSFTEQEWLDLIAKYKYRCVRCKKKVATATPGL